MRAPALQVHQPGTAAHSLCSFFVPCSMSKQLGRMLGNGSMCSGESCGLSNQHSLYWARQKLRSSEACRHGIAVLRCNF